MKPKVVVIGGGFAGISAATTLAEANIPVLLIEKKRILGGRALSYQDPQTQEIVDNGQHLLMGCYHHTLSLLKKLKTDTHLFRQPALTVEYLAKGNHFYQLNCPPQAGFWGLMRAFLKVDFLSLKDKLQTLVTLPLFFHKMKQPHLTLHDWLIQAKQPKRMIQLFWEPLCYAALNEDPKNAAALLMHKVIDEAFIQQQGVDGLIFPQTGLSELTSQATENYLTERDGDIKRGLSVKKITFTENQLTQLELTNGEQLEPKAVISALPPHALRKLLTEQPQLTDPLDRCESAPILSIHLWLRQPLTEKPFLALIDSPIQWIFNRQKIWQTAEKAPYLYSLILSGAHNWIKQPNQAIEAMVQKELTLFFADFDPTHIERIKVIKEQDATLSPSPNVLSYRLKQKTGIDNFFISGDWTDTGLPATIESAVLSGKLAAKEYLKTVKKETIHERA